MPPRSCEPWGFSLLSCWHSLGLFLLLACSSFGEECWRQPPSGGNDATSAVPVDCGRTRQLHLESQESSKGVSEAEKNGQSYARLRGESPGRPGGLHRPKDDREDVRAGEEPESSCSRSRNGTKCSNLPWIRPRARPMFWRRLSWRSRKQRLIQPYNMKDQPRRAH